MSFTPHWLIFMGPCSENSQCYYYLKCEMDLPVACAKFYWEIRCHPNGNTLQWRHDGSDGFLNPQSHDCLLNRLFRCRSKKTPKLRVTGLCAGNSPVTGELPAQMASNAENVSIRWRHHDTCSSNVWIVSQKAPLCETNSRQRDHMRPGPSLCSLTERGGYFTSSNNWNPISATF